MSTEQPVTVSFRNRKLDDTSSLRRIVGGALTKPLIASVTPVMLITLFEALQGRPIADLLRYGFIISSACALIWTLLQLARTPAVITFKHGRVRISTLLDMAIRTRPGKWQFIIDLKQEPSVIGFTLGHRIYDLKKDDWADFASIGRMLDEAQNEYTSRIFLNS